MCSSDSATSIQRILNAQNAVLKHHLPSALYQSLETPPRHAGLNSVKVPGRPELKGKPPLILLHGFGSGLGFFFASLPYLAQSGRTVYLVDWLGCGGSDRPHVSQNQMGAEFFTTSLNRWMEDEGIENATVVGHSLGGLLAKEFSEKYSEKISSLVLASPAGFGSVSTQATAKESFVRQLLDVMWNSNMTPQHLIRMAGATRGRAMVTRAVRGRFGNHSEFNHSLIAEYLYEITVAKASGEYALNALLSPPFQQGAVVARRPISELPGKGKFPVHVIFGDHDWLGTPSACENAKSIGAKLTIMRNAGHHLYMDDPITFAKLCLST